MIAPQQLSEDRAVPGLTLAMDRGALLSMLAEQLPECRDELELLDARVADVQYSPGCAAQVLWKLVVRDLQNQRTCKQLICVKAFRRDDPLPVPVAEHIDRYAALRKQKEMARQMPLRTPWICVPAAHVLIHAFPLDPMLPTLIDVVDPRTMQEALHRAWRAHRVRVRRVRAETLAYTPGARAALRFDVLGEERDTGVPQIRRLVGKLDARRSPARLFAGHWALWRKSFGRVSIAPPTGYVAVAGLSLQEFLDGTRLSDLAGTGAFVGLLRQAARAIANVHGLTLPLLSTRGVDTEMRTVDRWTAVLARLCPANARRLEALAHRMRTELATRLRVEGTVHGDFHLANVMAGEHGITLIDWDQIAHGDPMVDVGRVLASMRVSSLRIHDRIDGFADLEENFLRTYLVATGADERRARLFEAIALLVSAAAPFRLQRDGWEDGAQQMLDEVERIFALSLAGAHVAGTPADAKREVAFEERPNWLADRPYMQSLLTPLVQQAYGKDIELTACTPKVCTRRGIRLQAAWELRGFQGNERWRRSVIGIGFHEDSGRGRLRRLETANEVVARHPNALQLPRPLGHLPPLSTIVFEADGSETLAAALGTRRERHALKRVAESLAYFHSLRIELGKQRDIMSSIEELHRDIAVLDAARHVSAAQARGLLARLEPLLLTPCDRLGPAVLGLRPEHIHVQGTRVAVSLFSDVLITDSRWVVGSLLARLSGGSLDRQVPPAAAARLRRLYADASGCSEKELGAFEAAYLLSKACRRGARQPARTLAPALGYAESITPSI